MAPMTGKKPTERRTAPVPLVIDTKLWPPLVREGALQREALVDMLQRSISRHSVTLISAGAGFGKTSLLAGWYQVFTDPDHVAWLTLDRADNDPMRLWTHIAFALRETLPARTDGSIEPSPRSIQGIVGALVNDLAAARGRRVLILDDLHTVQSPVGIAALDSFIAAAPPSTRVVISTRTDPAISLARLRAVGKLGELRDHDLAFTYAEAKGLAERNPQARLSPHDAEELRRRTEGWPAGMHLALLAAEKADDPHEVVNGLSGDMRTIADFLGAEVLAHLDAEIRSFLVQTAVLDELTGSLCDAALATTGAAERLRQLERANLFLVPLDDTYHWFRYHQLFRDMLRSEFARLDPGHRAAIHRRASAWYSGVGTRRGAAIEHALAALDWPEAARLIAAITIEAVREGRFATVLGWISALPEGELQAQPLLPAVAASIATALGYPWEQVEHWLDQYQQSRRRVPALDTSEAQWFASLPRVQFIGTDVPGAILEASRLLDMTAPNMRTIAHGNLAWALYLDGQLSRAEEAAALAVAGASGWPRGALLGNTVLALLAAEKGQGERALALAQEAIVAGSDIDAPLTALTARSRLALAMALALKGRLEQAESEAATALRAPGPPHDASRVLALIALASIRRRRGRFTRTGEALDEAERALRFIGSPGRLGSLLAEERKALEALQGTVPAIEPLSKAEGAVLDLLVSDMSLREIADALFLSQNTVKSHCRAIYRKLQAASRADAVARARDLGLLPDAASEED